MVTTYSCCGMALPDRMALQAHMMDCHPGFFQVGETETKILKRIEHADTRIEISESTKNGITWQTVARSSWREDALK